MTRVLLWRGAAEGKGRTPKGTDSSLWAYSEELYDCHPQDGELLKEKGNEFRSNTLGAGHRASFLFVVSQSDNFLI